MNDLPKPPGLPGGFLPRRGSLHYETAYAILKATGRNGGGVRDKSAQARAYSVDPYRRRYVDKIRKQERQDILWREAYPQRYIYRPNRLLGSFREDAHCADAGAGHANGDMRICAICPAAATALSGSITKTRGAIRSTRTPGRIRTVISSISASKLRREKSGIAPALTAKASRQAWRAENNQKAIPCAVSGAGHGFSFCYIGPGTCFAGSEESYHLRR